MGPFRRGPLKNIVLQVITELQKPQPELLSGEKWLKSKDYTLTERMCPCAREKWDGVGGEAETFLSNWVFYIPKALLFLTGFNTKYFHK